MRGTRSRMAHHYSAEGLDLNLRLLNLMPIKKIKDAIPQML